MQAVETTRAVAAMAETQAAESSEICRRIEGLRQVRALCGRFDAARERRYAQVMSEAATAIRSGRPAGANTLLELNLLGLELCDD
jgi:hypothetical protein